MPVSSDTADRTSGVRRRIEHASVAHRRRTLCGIDLYRSGPDRDMSDVLDASSGLQVRAGLARQQTAVGSLVASGLCIE